MAAKKRPAPKPLKLPKPRPRKHTPALDVRTGTGMREVPRANGGPPILTGGHPLNTGGKKGRSGRKSNAFKEMCRRVIDDPRIEERVEEILHGTVDALTSAGTVVKVKGGPRTFLDTLGLLASYVAEKPKSSVEVSRRLTLEELVAGSYREGDLDPDAETDTDDPDEE